jgi:hypothetical protein
MGSSLHECRNTGIMGKTNTTSYDEALSTVNGCLACLKNGGRNEDILFELSKAFDADDAVFLSASDGHQGVDLSHSFVLRKDRRFLDQYADSYWQFDPLYNVQFSPNSSQSVLKQMMLSRIHSSSIWNTTRTFCSPRTYSANSSSGLVPKVTSRERSRSREKRNTQASCNRTLKEPSSWCLSS